ncbi:MAG TPA: DUF2867 domain-containing protein [Acidimicrobiia bacterium]|nr:DUF2867 domain-containing protein [Acidimicrobiia bacterium]
MRIAVAGATGFVGRALVPALLGEGHEPVALARHPSPIPGATSHEVDIGDEDGVRLALRGCTAAYYLVHSLERGDFRSRDRQLAETFGRAAAAMGVTRIIYVGGLGQQPESEHLISRQETGRILGMAGVPVVELRAAVVLGTGSISFEMLRYLTERLPVMVCPRWVRTRIQPVALPDMVSYLLEALDVAPGVYEVGGADVTTYRDMISTFASARGLRPRHIINVPYLTPHLSSYWVDLVTTVDRRVSHALIQSLGTEVVVEDAVRTEAAFDVRPMGVRAAITHALEDQTADVELDLLDRGSGLVDGVYSARVVLPNSTDEADAIDADLDRIGGSYEWYGLTFAWRLRRALGSIVGERWRLRRAPAIRAGEQVDWWTVVRRRQRELVLRGVGWLVGDAWLGWRCDDASLVQVGAFRPKGIPGLLYWKLLQPIHRHVFVALARHRRERVTKD